MTSKDFLLFSALGGLLLLGGCASGPADGSDASDGTGGAFQQNAVGESKHMGAVSARIERAAEDKALNKLGNQLVGMI